MSNNRFELLSEEELDALELEEGKACKDEGCDCEKCSKDSEEELEDSKVDEKKENKDKEEMTDDIEEDTSMVEALAKKLGLKEESVADFKDIFETAVSLKAMELVEAKETEIQEASKKALEDHIASYNEEILDKADAWAEVIIKEWFEENKPAHIDSIQFHKNQKIVEGLMGVMEENALTIEESEIDVVDELNQTITGLKAELSESEEVSGKYRTLLESVGKKEEIAKYELSEALSEKVYKIIEDFEVNESLAGKIKDIVELVSESNEIKEEKETKELEESSEKKKSPSLEERFEDSFVPAEEVITEEKVDKPLTFDGFIRDLIE